MTKIADLSSNQLANARTIIAVGRSLGVPAKGWVVALATALQESTLRNLRHGDRDSQGLFQQRPSAGWGTEKQITDPVLAARAFYGKASHTRNRGLTDIPGWQQMSVARASQAVQVSAFPDAYAKWETLARALVARLAPRPGRPTITIDGQHLADVRSVSVFWINRARGTGHVSRHVYWMQRWLQEAGHDTGPLDGRWSATGATQHALNDFRSALGWTGDDATGEVGLASLRRLRQAAHSDKTVRQGR